MLAAAMSATASQTRPRRWVTRRAMNFEYDIGDPRWSEGKGEVVGAGGLMDERLVFGTQKHFSKRNPTTESGGRLGRRARPRAAGEGTAYADELVVLPHRQQRHARPFGKGQLEVAPAGITDQHVADERHFWSAI